MQFYRECIRNYFYVNLIQTKTGEIIYFPGFYYYFIAHLIFVDLALPFRWHSSFEGRMTFFATSLHNPSFCCLFQIFFTNLSSPEWNVRIATRPPGASICGNFSKNSSSTSNSLFTSIRNAWNVLWQVFFRISFFSLLSGKKASARSILCRTGAFDGAAYPLPCPHIVKVSQRDKEWAR